MQMNIALIVPGGVDRTGEYRVIPALLALLARLARRHEVHVFALHQEPRPAEWDLLGAHIHNIGTRATRRRALVAILRSHRAQRFDVIHAIWSGSCGALAVCAARLLRVPSLVHVAGGELVALPQIRYGGQLTWRGRLRERIVLRMASCVTTASAPMIAQVQSFGVRATRVPLGVDLETWAPRLPQRREHGASLRLLHVASLNLVKDQTTLLRAVAMLVNRGLDMHLDVIGEDTLHGRVQQLALELGISTCVTFHGFRTQGALRPLVEAADVLVMSSLHEAGPVVVLEAAVSGVPTVGTAVGHIAEWSCAASLAVAPGNAARLAAALRRVASNEELRLDLAHEAFNRATREDADFTADAFERIYERLVHQRELHVVDAHP